MKRNKINTILFLLLLLGITGCNHPDPIIRIQFDSDKEVSGQKIALSAFSDTLPTDWSAYNYAVMELKCSTSQRVFVGFNTETGYNELRIIFYATNGWIRCALPLTYFRDLPSGAFDLAATYNQKRPLSFINIEHGVRRPLVGVDSIGFRLHWPINNPAIEIRSFSLAVEDPGDEYLEDSPAVDRFGQWALGHFDGKATSLEELEADWRKEEAELKALPDNGLSVYGGNLSHKTKATGFFRTEKIDGKWWFVDPEGHLFLSQAANIMRTGTGFVLNPIPGVYENTPPEGFELPENSRYAKGIPYGAWNLYRRFGGNYTEEANRMAMDRMASWGLNTIGNWSDRRLMDRNEKPFMIMFNRLGVENGILGMPDIYEADFVEKNAEAVNSIAGIYRNNPMLLGYFFGNEPTWSHQELRLCELILEADDNRPIKIALQEHLKKGDTPSRRKEFVYLTFRKFLTITQQALRKADPNHLTLGIRFGSGVPAPEVLEICKEFFDVYSFNQYGMVPNKKNMDFISEQTGLPMIIGEFHFGTTDRGLGMSLIQVNSQEERGIAYRHYAEQAFSHPAVIGTSWFQWADQEILGRMDGENYNIGLVDVTDRPYPHMIEAVRQVARNFYRVHAGETPPYSREIKRVAIAGQLPDKWE